MRVLQINSVVNSGSTGRITEEIGQVLLAKGHDSYIAFGRGKRPSQSKLIRIGGRGDIYLHVLFARLFDKDGLGSVIATRHLIQSIEEIKPDIIGLHNLHGYYLNYRLLFEYSQLKQIPILWTIYDCWAFTGHCTYFDDIDCVKWRKQCFNCPKYKNYPTAWFDHSARNFSIKKALFTKSNKINLLVHSHWLAKLLKQSFLAELPIYVQPSGIDLDVFSPHVNKSYKFLENSEKKIVLGCANIWTERKGLDDMIQLSSLLSDDFQVILIGLNKKQIDKLPNRIIGYERTESTAQLAAFYSKSIVFVNPTYQDNFPTTNIEALACGTPVVTYNTGGSPEAVDENTGRVVQKGDIHGLANAIFDLQQMDRETLRQACRKRAEEQFDKNKQYSKYLNIYKQLVNV